VTRSISGGDTLPWHRQFWPWFLLLLPGSVVIAGFATLYIANRHADDLVVDDYYQEGLAINRQLDAKRRASDLHLSARLQFQADLVTARIEGPVTEPALLLVLSHPLEADQDFSVPLSRVGPGLYRGGLQRQVAPRWHWTLQSLDDHKWRLDGAVRASEVGRGEGG